MSTTTFATRFAALALGGALVLPMPGAIAGDGGASPGSAASVAGSGGVTLGGPKTGIVRTRHRFTGSVPRRSVNRRVLVQRRTSTGWKTVASATPHRGGAFAAGYTPHAAGRFPYRAVIAGRSGAGAPRIGVTVFPRARATWYGPGFYGHRAACGVTLSKTTMGVAHKTLPCGTKVTLLYHGRTLTTTVIDRGPYAAGLDYDLTSATAQALGMAATSTIGALLRR